MLDFLQKKLDKLLHELAIYQEQMNDAVRLEDEQLYKNAQSLGEETLSQIWEARKQIENNKKKGLYYVESESA